MAKAKIGRPSDFSQECADDICEAIASGVSLREFCSEDSAPNRSTVFRWLEQNEGFRDQYARARESQAETYADEIVDIADEAEDAQLARLQIDARKWAASKLAPKKYGDKVTQELTGAEGAPLDLTVRFVRD